jgi:hypothetical protein
MKKIISLGIALLLTVCTTLITAQSGLQQMNLPVTFEDVTVDYGVIGFGGAEISTIAIDPTDITNAVVKVVKDATAATWAGTTITAPEELGLASEIPLTAANTKMSLRVWSPNAGIQVRLKIEEHANPTHSCETGTTVTTAAGWQTLVFDFSNESPGTAVLNLNYNFDLASVFFNYGVQGSQAGEKTYYFDDLMLYSSAGLPELNEVGVTVFPNPTAGKTEINCLTEIEYIEVYSALGELVFQKKVNAKSTSLDLSEFNSGIYVLKVFSNNHVNSFKMAKD